MTNNETYGLTAEDLEKAASVRLFEKAAAAEGINLNELSESQVDELYHNYQQSSEENTMNEQILDLFEKQASYEGVDLDALSDEELAHVYNNFVANLEQELEKEASVESEIDDVAEFLTDKTEAVYEMLMDKEAGALSNLGSKAKGYAKGGYMVARDAALGRRGRGQQAAAVLGAAGAAGAAGYGAKKLNDKRKAKKEMKKEAAEETMLNAFNEFLVDNHGVTSDDLDQDTFVGAYNDFLDIVADDLQKEASEEVNEFLSDKTEEVYNLVMGKEASTALATVPKTFMQRHGGKILKGGLGTVAAGGLAYGGKKLYDNRKAKKAMEKQAAEEAMLGAFDEYLVDNHGVSASDLDEDTFNNTYNEFLDLVANDAIVEAEMEEDATEKLAEAEILGRHMARAYMDEMEKEAMDGAQRSALYAGAGGLVPVLPTGTLGGYMGADEGAKTHAGTGAFLGGLAGRALGVGANMAAGGGLAGGLAYRAGVAGGNAGGAYLGHRMAEKQAAAEDEVLAELFVKQANYEGIDLDYCDDDEIDYMYDNFLDMLNEDDVEYVKEAAAKTRDERADEINKKSRGGIRGSLAGAGAGATVGAARGAARSAIGGTIAHGLLSTSKKYRQLSKATGYGGMKGAVRNAKGMAAIGAGIGGAVGGVRGAYQGAVGGADAKQKGKSAVMGGLEAGFRGGSPLGKGTRKAIKKVKSKMKKEAALEEAAHYLIENGIDPQTGEWLD